MFHPNFKFGSAAIFLASMAVSTTTFAGICTKAEGHIEDCTSSIENQLMALANLQGELTSNPALGENFYGCFSPGHGEVVQNRSLVIIPSLIESVNSDAAKVRDAKAIGATEILNLQGVSMSEIQPLNCTPKTSREVREVISAGLEKTGKAAGFRSGLLERTNDFAFRVQEKFARLESINSKLMRDISRALNNPGQADLAALRQLGCKGQGSNHDLYFETEIADQFASGGLTMEMMATLTTKNSTGSDLPVLQVRNGVTSDVAELHLRKMRPVQKMLMNARGQCVQAKSTTLEATLVTDNENRVEFRCEPLFPGMSQEDECNDNK